MISHFEIPEHTIWQHTESMPVKFFGDDLEMINKWTWIREQNLKKCQCAVIKCCKMKNNEKSCDIDTIQFINIYICTYKIQYKLSKENIFLSINIVDLYMYIHT